jgi:hypothetical protein
VYATIAELKEDPEKKVYLTVCYGPFESPEEAREYVREFMDAPAAIVELREPKSMSPAIVREALRRF